MSEPKEMLRGKKIGIVGAGNMGRALALGMIRSGLVPASALMASDVDAAQRKALEEKVGIRTTEKNSELVGFASVVVLAVKPQTMDQVLREIAPILPAMTLVISIAAGIPLARLEKALSKHAVVRVMPNTPALVGKGMAALCPGAKANAEHMDLACAILGCVGEILRVPEAWMDAVTATSGSGPAYVFYFIEALTAGAVALGIESAAAQKLVVETFAGSLELLKQSGESPETLRKRVTSPGGTTEAALRFLDSHGAKKIIADALAAAAKRGGELSSA